MDSAGELTTNVLAGDLGGYYLVYRGEVLPVLFAGEGWLAVSTPPDTERFPDAVEFGRNSRGDWAKLPIEALDRRFRRRVEATWQGEPVTVVGPVVDGTVVLNYMRSPEFAKQAGMQGDQYNYWSIRVPVSELVVTDVVDEEVDG